MSEVLPNQRDTLDFNNATFVRKRVSVADPNNPDYARVVQGPAGTQVLPSVPAMQQAVHQSIPSPVAPAVQTAQPVQVEQAAIPVPQPVPGQLGGAVTSPPPVNNDWPNSVKARIGKIWAQKSESDRRAEAYERQLQDALARLEQATRAQSGSAGAAPYTNQFGSSPSQSPASPDAISRTELQRILQEDRAQLLQAFSVQSAQTRSTEDARRDFPEVFADPRLSEAASTIYQSDPALQQDPNGPWKAAAFAVAVGRQNSSGPSTAVLDAQKQQAAGIGISPLPTSGAPSGGEYHAALDLARRTGDPDAWARVLAMASR